jgi:alpha-N-arabinofuranosidase
MPIFWTEDGWLKVGTDGTCRAAYEVVDGTCTQFLDAEYPTYHWEVKKDEAYFVRCPDYDNYRFVSENQFMLKGVTDSLNSKGNVTFVGMRQPEFQCVAKAGIDTTTMVIGQQAGITVYMDEGSHYDLVVTKEVEYCRVACVAYISHMPVVMEELCSKDAEVILSIEGEAERYSFFAQNDQGSMIKLGSAESKYLSSEVAEGFTGVLIAAYCVANEEKESGFVSFTTY